LDFLLSSQLGLTRESLFEILARSKTRILDPKILRDSRETCESKLVARLADRNFVVRIARSKSRNKILYQVLQINFVARLASLANKNFVARLARIITNFNSGALQESCENFGSKKNFSL
jgi:hypothetical protein